MAHGNADRTEDGNDRYREHSMRTLSGFRALEGGDAASRLARIKPGCGWLAVRVALMEKRKHEQRA